LLHLTALNIAKRCLERNQKECKLSGIASNAYLKQTVTLLAYAYEGSNPSPTTTPKTLTQTHFYPYFTESRRVCWGEAFRLFVLFRSFPNRPEIWLQIEYKAEGLEIKTLVGGMGACVWSRSFLAPKPEPELF
jgi:hypothetical protein